MLFRSEDSLAGALREAREELGVTLEPDQGRLAFSRVRDWVKGVRFGDILDVWEFRFDGEADLSAADGEVAQARWVERGEIARLLSEGQMVETLEYFLEGI